jgi:dual specificity tyrosine-phosphorylation-regulated kinase 2/3/4
MLEILQFSEVFFLGYRAVKVLPTTSPQHNFGFDLPSHHYNVNPRDHIAYRYENRSVLGCGAFGQVLKCCDHKTGELVAVKIVINTPQMEVQGRAEMEMVTGLNVDGVASRSNVVKILDTFVFRGHICATFELLGQNLYEHCRSLGFGSMPMPQVKRVARQLLRALAFIHSHDIVHCDMKPENVLLVPGAKEIEVRIIDFGSACHVGQKHFDYIQSRFYRAPEVIFGIPYGPPMDIWSFACITAELVAGRPLFPGESEANELHLHMELLGMPPETVLADAKRRTVFFHSDGRPREPLSKRTKSLEKMTRIHDPDLLNLLMRCLEWDQTTRITAEAALNHPFFAQPDAQPPPSPRRSLSPAPSQKKSNGAVPSPRQMKKKEVSPPPAAVQFSPRMAAPAGARGSPRAKGPRATPRKAFEPFGKKRDVSPGSSSVRSGIPSVRRAVRGMLDK